MLTRVLKSRNHRSTVTLTIIGVAGILVIGTVVVKAWLVNRKPEPKQNYIESVQLGASSDRKAERIETELITVTRTGFEPTEIRRPSGTFFLQIENRSEMQLDLRLDRESRENIRARPVDRKALEWHEELNLAPGVYVLTSSTRPDWNCRITITAK